MKLQTLLHNLEKINVQLDIARRYNEDDMALFDISEDLNDLIEELRLEEKAEQAAEEAQATEGLAISKPTGKQIMVLKTIKEHDEHGKSKLQNEIEQELRKMGVVV